MIDASAAYHYHVIERAIREIDAAGPGLTLDGLAARMGMSAAHFQRVFSSWVGVSPKRYQQYLTLDHAKTLLAERHTTLAAAEGASLSGSGRLHDLFVTWEAMTPGDFARAGEGLTIRHGRFDSPFGRALVMGTERGICGIGFAADMGEEATFADLARRWPKAQFTPDAQALLPWAMQAFGARNGQNEATPLFLIGAPFQIKVWEALLRVPSGHVTTYGDIAALIGQPRAVRAVGTAVGHNPISLLIPCHRALRKSGALGGYHWGLPLKRAMLARESAQVEGTQLASAI